MVIHYFTSKNLKQTHNIIENLIKHERIMRQNISSCIDMASSMKPQPCMSTIDKEGEK